MTLSTRGSILVDEYGRQRVLHGINLVDKGRPGSTDPRDFQGSWSERDLDQLVEIGLDAVRLGVIWAATEPEPGKYSEQHLGWIGQQLDLMHQRGLAVILDGHQDLYSQAHSDGAPPWATLTDHPFEATELWSDAYLTSPAVHEAYDAFWADALAADGVGIQTRYVALWGMLAQRFGDHPAVIGYDVLNEPTLGAASAEVFGALIGAFAEATEQDPTQVFADFEVPERKLAQLAHLEDPAVHRRIGDTIAPLLTGFEQEQVHGLYQRIVAAIREHDREGLILREHDYFANIGIPVAIDVLEDHAWAYSPHGYDLVVDTEAMPLASNQRVETIFARAQETAQRLDVPVLVGEWGAFDAHRGIARHADHQLELFDRWGWSWFYWCWIEGFADTEAAARLRRPRPVAIAGEDAQWGTGPDGWQATWYGSGGDVPSIFWIPEELDVELLVDDHPADLARDGAVVRIGPVEGEHLLRVV